MFIALFIAIHLEMERTVAPLNESLTQQIVDARGEQISSWFEQRMGEVELLAALAAEHGWQQEDMFREAEELELMRKDEYESIRIVDADGWSWSREDEPFSIVDRDYYKHLLTGNSSSVVSNMIRSHAVNRAEIVVILQRVEPRVHDEVAYIAAAVPIAKMKEIAQEIHVYDGMGKLLDEYETAEGKHDDSLQNKKAQLATFTSPILQVPGWELMFQVPESQLSQGTKRTQRSALIVGAVMGLFLLTLLLLLAKSIVRPIRSLQIVMQQVEEGDRSLRASVQERDEIGELSKSFNQMLVKLYGYEQEKKEMELQLIQEQIKPHFLYNTLDTIQWKADAYGADDVVELVESLSTYFRLGLGSGSQYVTLEQELYHVESYMHIQCVRYEDILEYELMYDEHLGDKRVIRFLLQPLVENAIYHGIKPLCDRKSKISIKAYEDHQALVIRVDNNGQQIAPERLNQIRESLKSEVWRNDQVGFGLYSVNHRIKLAYGEPYGLRIYSDKGLTSMVLQLPLEESNEDVECAYR
ncbi:histidine kinase [Paenibacillus dakarensis]|uniref:histidine kinase n=1 Tax=Paenibacillus dakarensis TaxID=1527293 RepID=UPI0006D53C0B|nr:histidine kinase [Paenibacillus dakarensis]